MKLKKLEIHNIASISDAIIDFEAEPLASAPVFLISGPTGAGKSTILDAICLALYDAVPRMERTRMRGRADDTDNFNPDADDPRQLLSQGANEGYARLSFTANNGKIYQAVWSTARTVRRSKDAEAGKIKNRCRYLTCISDPSEPDIDKVTQVNKRVEELCGLTYEQFCRTTMLAQGEFANFLLSDNKSKADILEKITGKDIYARIGRQIFTEYRERETNLRILQQQAGSITLFTTEERQAKDADYKRLEGEMEKLRKEIVRLQSLRGWLTHRDELARKSEEDLTRLTQAQATYNSEDIREMRVLLERWDATIEVRRISGECSSVENDINDIQSAIDLLRVEYCTYLAAKELRVAAAVNKQHRIREYKSGLSTYQDLEEAFIHASEINDILTKLSDAEQRLRDAIKKIDDIDTDMDALIQDVLNAGRELDARNADVKSADNSAAEVRSLLETYDFEKLTDENNAASARLTSLKEIAAEAEIISELLLKIDADSHALNNLEAKIAAAKETQCNRQESANTAAADLEAKTKIYELVAATVEEKSNTLRALLNPGCKCPVCLQTVTNIVQPDQEAESRLRLEAEKQLNDAGTIKIQADAALNESLIEVARLTSQLKTDAERLEQQRNELRSKSEALALKMQICEVTAETVSAAIEDTAERIKVSAYALKERVIKQGTLSPTRNGFES